MGFPAGRATESTMLKYNFFILCVALFFLLDITAAESGDEESGDEASAKRTLGESDKQKIRDQFRETLVKGILSGTQQALENAPIIGQTAGWIYKMIAEGIGNDSPWDRMEHLVERKIRTMQTDKHLDDLADDWNFINYRLMRAQNGKFDKTDFADIRSKYPKFFPQQNDDIVYSIRWPINLIRYITALNAVTIDYMINDIADECAWARQLKVLKPDIFMAVKALAKARYRELEKKKNHGGVTLFKPTAQLSFVDTPTGTEYNKIPVTQVQKEVIWHLEDKTSEELFDVLVTKFNLMFNETWTPKSCNPPSIIESHELSYAVKFPRECTGEFITPSSIISGCTYPCGHYGKKYKWCSWFEFHMPESGQYDNKWTQVISVGNGKAKEVVGWRKCNLPDWDSCKKISKVKEINWTVDDLKKD